MVPPSAARQLPPVLLARMLLTTVNVPKFAMAPPPLLALLPEKVQLVTLAVPVTFKMAPPTPPVLLTVA